MTLPGPYTLSGRLRTGPGEVYATRVAAAEAFVPILSAELSGLVDAGATIIQIDEPSPAIHPDAPADFAALFNAAIEPVRGPGPARRPPLLRQLPRPAAGGPLVSADPRRDARLRASTSSSSSSPTARWPRSTCSRELADAGRDVAAGVIDVKNYHLETADEVAARIDAILATGVPAERLTLVPDCGFSQTARWATTAKLRALVAGRDLVRGRTGSAPTTEPRRATRCRPTTSRCSAPG